MSYVLDKGFVRLIDHLGDDDTIIETAHASRHGTVSQPPLNDEDKKHFIKQLYKDRHTSVFEFINFTFNVRAPIFVARQWMRHRTGKYIEQSLRYCEANPVFYYPPDSPESVRKLLESSYFESVRVYQLLLKRGEKKEMARICLPVSLYTEFKWNIDLHNLLHFIQLRQKGQWEIAQYANALLDEITPVVPYVVECYKGCPQW